MSEILQWLALFGILAVLIALVIMLYVTTRAIKAGTKALSAHTVAVQDLTFATRKLHPDSKPSKTYGESDRW